MDQAFLNEMRLKLEALRDGLRQELGQVAMSGGDAGSLRARFPDYGDKDDESALEVAEFTDNLSIERTLEWNLEDVAAALLRLGSGTYGTCRYCSQPIDERRLRARPESGACVACKAARRRG